MIEDEALGNKEGTKRQTEKKLTSMLKEAEKYLLSFSELIHCKNCFGMICLQVLDLDLGKLTCACLLYVTDVLHVNFKWSCSPSLRGNKMYGSCRWLRIRAVTQQ